MQSPSETVFLYSKFQEAEMKVMNGKVSLVAAAPALTDAVHIAALGFVKEESRALAEDVDTHLHSGRLVYRIFVGCQEVGFAIFAVYGDILYLSGIILIPDFQGMGIAQKVVEQVRMLHPQCIYLALRTQSLRMYLAAAKLCDAFCPQLHEPEICTEFGIRGALLAEAINSRFPVHVGCYGGPLYGEKPIYRDAELQCQWDQLCNFDNGDAVIFIGSLA